MMLNNSAQWLTFRSIDDHSSTLRPDTRSSLDYHSSAKRNANGLSHLKQNGLPTLSLTPLSTPHDHVLENMYNHSGKSESVLPLPSKVDPSRPQLDRGHSRTGGQHHTNATEANPYQNTRSLNEPANIREGAASTTPTASFVSHTFPVTRLYDPFDGSPLGVILPVTTRDGDSMPVHVEGSSNEELWAHLSRVLDLQNQIARMHVDMEGVGLGKQADGKGKGPLGGTPRATGLTRTRTASTSSVPGADIGDEEGVGVVDEEAEKLKAREREFKNLATQFEGRKEAINKMMGKVSNPSVPPGRTQYLPAVVPQLDDLSKALTEFHSLQVPKIEFPSSSRNDSLGFNINDQIQAPFIVPSDDSLSPTRPTESNIRSSTMPMPAPTPYPEPPSLGVEPNISSNSTASTQLLSASLGRKGPVPTVILDSIGPDSQTHVLDSPASTISLKLPQ